MQNIYRFCIYANCMASAGCSVKRNAAYQKNIIVHNCRGTLWSLLASMLNQRLPGPQKKRVTSCSLLHQQQQQQQQEEEEEEEKQKKKNKKKKNKEEEKQRRRKTRKGRRRRRKRRRTRTQTRRARTKMRTEDVWYDGCKLLYDKNIILCSAPARTRRAHEQHIRSHYYT